MKPVAAAVGGQYQVPPEPSRWPSIALAAAVHAGLLAFLYIGVNWQNTQPVQVEAEVWDMKTQSAAPPPPPPEVVEPEPEPEPRPAPKVVEPPPPPPKVEQPVAPKPPDIALEREKQKAEKRKLLEEKKLEEQKLAKERKAQELAEQKAEKKAAELAEKKAQELADKKAAKKAQELEEKKLAEKLKADKLAKAKEAAADQKRLDKVRADEMRRITAGAGESGEAPKATAPRLDTSYLAAINSKIKGSTSYAGSTDVPGRPEVLFKIEQLPTGEIISVRLLRSSGIPAFDDAVEKGILKSSPLPKNKNGTVLRTLEIAFAMKDLK